MLDGKLGNFPNSGCDCLRLPDLLTRPMSSSIRQRHIVVGRHLEGRKAQSRIKRLFEARTRQRAEKVLIKVGAFDAN